MPKKAKNRSSKQAKQRRQAKAVAVRQDRKVEAILEATEAAIPATLASGQFHTRNGDQEVIVTLEEIRQRVNALDDEWPLDDVSQVADMLRDEVQMGLVFLHPDGLWRLPEEYLPKAGQA